MAAGGPFPLPGGGSVVPTSVVGNGAVGEPGEKEEGSFRAGSCVGAAGAAVWGMALRQSASFGNRILGSGLGPASSMCPRERVTSL